MKFKEKQFKKERKGEGERPGGVRRVERVLLRNGGCVREQETLASAL